MCTLTHTHLHTHSHSHSHAHTLTLTHMQLVNKGIFMMSLISNKGVLRPRRQQQASATTNSFKAKLELAKAVFLEPELPYHWFYLSICLFGFLVHEFLFVILLVRDHVICTCRQLYTNLVGSCLATIVLEGGGSS